MTDTTSMYLVNDYYISQYSSRYLWFYCTAEMILSQWYFLWSYSTDFLILLYRHPWRLIIIFLSFLVLYLLLPLKLQIFRRWYMLSISLILVHVVSCDGLLFCGSWLLQWLLLQCIFLLIIRCLLPLLYSLVQWVDDAAMEVLAVKSVDVICCSISVRRHLLRCLLLSRSISFEVLDR